MTILTVRHVTTYRYKQPVSFGDHRLMVRPRESYDQRLIESTLHIVPEPASLYWHHDVFGNVVGIACFGGRAKELRFDSMVRLEHRPTLAVDFRIEEHARTYPFSYGAYEMPDLLRSIERQWPDPRHAVDGWARRFVRTRGPTPTEALLADMTHAIRREFTYVARHEKGTQPPTETLRLGRGTCRDFAVLMMEAARALGFAARFVSGYVYSPARAARRAADEADGRDRRGGGSTHAWVRIFLPGAGWVEFDPTNGIVGNQDLIRVAIVRDPAQAVPLSGTYMGFPNAFLGMDVTVDVTAEAEPEAEPASDRSRA